MHAAFTCIKKKDNELNLNNYIKQRTAAEKSQRGYEKKFNSANKSRIYDL